MRDRTPGSVDLDPQILGVLAYVPFGGFGGLFVYLTANDGDVRFHGAQSVLLSVLTLVALVAGAVIGLAAGRTALMVLITAVWLVSVAASVYLAIQGYHLRQVRLPLVGAVAMRLANR